MNQRLIDAAILVAVAAGAITAITWRASPPSRSREHPPFDALDAVPRDAPFVATLDLGRLRDSPLGSVLAGSGRELWGLGSIEDVCGTDPTASMRSLALVLPPDLQIAGEARDDVGFAAGGDFDAEEIVRCASATLDRRGGRAVSTHLGSFIAVRDASGSSVGEVGVRDGGPVLFADGATLREMVDTADGRTPSAKKSATHTRLRKALGTDGALIATWKLAPDWLARLTGEPLARLSPLSRATAMALRIDLVPEVKIRAAIECGAAELCGEISTLVEWFREEHLAPSAADLGLDLSAQRFLITEAPSLVVIEHVIDQDEAEIAIVRALSRISRPSAPHRDPSETEQVKTPDEIIDPTEPRTVPQREVPP